MNLSIESVKRNAIKAIFVVLAVAGGFALVSMMEIPEPTDTAQMYINVSDQYTG